MAQRMNKPAWMITEEETDSFFENTVTGADYWKELTIAQAKKILEFQINIAVFKGHVSLHLLKKMLSELEGKDD
jgi:hypothetical protein